MTFTGKHMLIIVVVLLILGIAYFSRTAYLTPLMNNNDPVQVLDRTSSTRLLNVEPSPVRKLSNMTDPSLRILYNRIPKCGSAAIQEVVHRLSIVNNFTFLPSPVNDRLAISSKEENELTKLLNRLRPPVMFDRHVYFLDFTRYNERWPTYINVMRDPLERMVSWFYYSQNGREGGRLKGTESNQTYDQSISHVNVNTTNLQRWNQMIQFFCGHTEVCQARNKEALAIAKSNIEKHYSVVGFQEDLGSFFTVLETVSPRMFKGAAAIYNSTNASMYAKLKTARKTPPSPKTVETVRILAALDYELFYFVKQRFKQQMSALSLIKT